MVDRNDVVYEFQKSEAPFSDGHDMITFTVASSLTPPPPGAFTFRDFKAVDGNELCDCLAACECSVFNGSYALDTCFDCLYNNLNQAVQRCAPVKKVMNTSTRCPWFTHELDLLNEVKVKRYRRYDITTWMSDWYIFTAARNRTQDAIEEAKLLFYHERLKDLHYSKQIWKELKNLGLCENEVDSPSKFSSEELNAHSSHVSFDTHAPSIADYLEGLSIPKDYFPRFSLYNVRAEDVMRALCSFTTQARGSDDIPQSFIKSALCAIGPYIL